MDKNNNDIPIIKFNEIKEDDLPLKNNFVAYGNKIFYFAEYDFSIYIFFKNIDTKEILCFKPRNCISYIKDLLIFNKKENYIELIASFSEEYEEEEEEEKEEKEEKKLIEMGCIKLYRIYNNEVKSELIIEDSIEDFHYLFKFNNKKIMYSDEKLINLKILNTKTKQIETKINTENGFNDLGLFLKYDKPTFNSISFDYAKNISNYYYILEKLRLKNESNKELIFKVENSEFDIDIDFAKGISESLYNFNIYTLDNKLNIKKYEIKFLKAFGGESFQLKKYYKYFINNYFYFYFTIYSGPPNEYEMGCIGRININEDGGNKYLEHIFESSGLYLEDFEEMIYSNNKFYIVSKCDINSLVEIDESKFSSLECR